MAKDVKNNIAEAIAARREQQANPQDQNQSNLQNQNQVNQEVEFLKAQVQSLQQQLQQKNSESEQRRLEMEADRLRKEEEALQEEANLKQSLANAFQGSSDSSGEELSQKELVSILADAVGKSADAQSKLILKQVSNLVNQTNEKVSLTQKALIEVMGAMDVNNTQSRYSDFNNYRDDIAALMSRSNLSSEDAYLLAKAKRQSLAPGKETVESERPGQPPQTFTRSERSVPRHEEEEEDYGYNPRAVFKDAVSSAIDNVLARRNK